MQCNSVGPISFYTDSKGFKSTSEPNCVMSCCLSCSFCRYKGATTKERYKPRSYEETNKACQRCTCVVPCLFAPNVPNAPSVANSLTVEGCLQKFWQVWEKLGSSPRVVSILKEGYTLPFKMRPPSQGHQWFGVAMQTQSRNGC